MNIFLVEDSRSIRRLLVRRLEGMSGARIVGEANGQDEALALINWLQPEMVLLDLSLASGSGLQVLSGLRQRGFRGQVMVLTSQSIDAYREACTAAGADGFYDKASGLETLFDDLGVMLENERRQTGGVAPSLLLRDALTGLYDQVSLLERTDQATKMMARDHGEVAACVLMLNGLDTLRDSHGEAAVEAVLRETAARLAQACTPADVLARHASNQFSLVMTRVDSAADAALFVQRLQQLMNQPFDFQGQILPVQAQLGLALFPRDAISARALLTLAEARAYGALTPSAATVFTH
jgi:diguanylate cyclase (GGDEF)-like protein